MKKIVTILQHKLSELPLKTQLVILMFCASVLLLTVQFIYIFQSYHMLRNSSMKYADNMMRQVDSGISAYINGMINSSQAVSDNITVQEYLTTQDPARRYSYVKFVKSFINYIVYSNEGIQDIAILDSNHQIIFSGNSPIFEINQYLEDNHPGYMEKTYSAPFFDMVTTSNGAVYCIYVRTITPPYSSHRLASCITVYDNHSIQEIINNVNLTDNTELYLYNEDNTIIASNNYNSLNTILPASLSAEKDSSFLLYNSKRCITKTYAIQNTGWNLVCIIPEKEILAGMTSHMIFGILSTIITLIILLLLTVTLWHNIAAPVHTLNTQLAGIGQINRHQRIRVEEDTENEIMQVGIMINKMLAQIEHLNEKIFQSQASLYEAQLLKKEAELFALQNQINPHFLYNTLDCIRDIALVYQVEEISSISISMSKMFRYCIKRESTVTVLEELECIKDYLNIIQIRYMNRFHITLDIDPIINSENILKFILQPLVENALYHGLERKAGSGSLLLKGGKTAEGSIYFTVYDTGIGIPADKLEQLNSHLVSGEKPDETQSHTGIGLFNIHSRIRTHYGNPFGVSLESREGEWTRVTITMPEGIRSENK